MTVALQVQQDVDMALKIIEGALPLLGEADLVPVLQALQTFEALVMGAIESKTPVASAALAAEVQAADLAAQVAEVAKFGNT